MQLCCAEVHVLVSVCITQEVCLCVCVCVCVRMCVCVCVCVCVIISLYGWGYLCVRCYSILVLCWGFFVFVFCFGFLFQLLSWMFQHDCLDTCVKCLIKLYACVLYFCICPCSAQLSMSHMERRSRNTLIIIIIIINWQMLSVFTSVAPSISFCATPSSSISFSTCTYRQTF